MSPGFRKDVPVSMKRRSQSKSRGLVLLIGTSALVLALVLSLRSFKDGGLHRAVESGTPPGVARLTMLEADQGRDGGIRRQRFGRWQEERRAALDLARKMGEKQALVLSERMIRRADEPPFPRELIEEASRMKASQLRMLIRESGGTR